MTHYLIAQLNGGRYGGQQILSAQGINALHEPAVSEGRADRFYGMGWVSRSLNEIPVVRHDGVSANDYANVVLDPTEKWGVVILINTPDFGYTILACTVLMVFWCIIWVVLNWLGTPKQTPTVNGVAE